MMNFFGELKTFLVSVYGSVERSAARSSHWQTVRNTYMESHKTCEACGRLANQCHHVLSFRLYPEDELEPANLIALCDTCHLEFGHLGCFESINPLVREEAARHLAMVKARPYTKKQVDAFRSRYK